MIQHDPQGWLEVRQDWECGTSSSSSLPEEPELLLWEAMAALSSSLSAMCLPGGVSAYDTSWRCRRLGARGDGMTALHCCTPAWPAAVDMGG